MYELMAGISLFMVLGLGIGAFLLLLIKIYMCLFDKLLELLSIKRAFLRWIFAVMPRKEKRKGGND